ncbi:hypothetical protein C2S51_001494 [Perilla frutescens var. frutescens]|nr:hypothetical protein C2S51_001494 [Perilla frutescens var. frutescens]
MDNLGKVSKVPSSGISADSGKETIATTGIRATDSFQYMANDAGGEDCVSHTLKDHLNYVNRLKMSIIEGGDAQTLIDELYAQGINNHWKNVMFGCAFISDERIKSFLWLFEVFKKSMEGKCHISMFTDQNLAIGTAIEQIFPDTRHRLCLWHLYQNTISWFGNLKANKSFINEFKKCLSGCTNREEFEHCWSSMISTYHLEDNSWFSRLYLLREKWCTGLNKDFFSSRILSSQRNESTNSAIGFNARKSTSLTEFYDIFKRTVQSWRRNEASDEFQCSRAQPTSFMPLTGLLKHASEMMRKYYATVMKVKDNEEGRKILEEEHNKVVAYVEELMSTLPSVGDTDVSSSSIQILDLARSTTKARRKRIKGHLQKTKKKNTSVISISKEFGSKTPNPRLF